MVGCGSGTEVESVEAAILVCNGTPCPAGWYCDSSTLECMSPVCRSCQNLPHAYSECVAQCEITCAPGWADCDHLVSNGCEVSTTTTANCGACGAACAAPAHTTPTCLGGACGVGGCVSGWADCNGNSTDGCETSLATSPSCGACGHVCGAGQLCHAGVCQAKVCGDGYCDPGETTHNCTIDCGCPSPLVDCCGDGVCRALKACLTAC